jgi:hypothetical protein
MVHNGPIDTGPSAYLSNLIYSQIMQKIFPALAGGDRGEGVSFDNLPLPNPLPSRERGFLILHFMNNPD